MAQILGDYLAEMAGRPFVYGVDDCATFVLGWLDRVNGKRALDAWRGMYVDEASCEAFIAANGGFAAIASPFFADHYGLSQIVPDPFSGDLRTLPNSPGPIFGRPVFATFKDISAMGLRVDATRVAMRTRAGVIVTARATITDEWGPA